MDHAALHAAGDGHELAGDVAGESSEARTTTCAATSSGVATLRSAIVRVIRRTASSLDMPAGHRRHRPTRRDRVDAHARGEARPTSFFSERRRPPWIADFAAA